MLTGLFGDDMSGILKLAEALPHSQLTSLRWPAKPLELCMDFVPLLAFASAAYDASHLYARPLLYSLAGNVFGPEGCKTIAAVLDKTQITSLKCASHLAQRLTLRARCAFAWLCVSSL